MNCFQYFRERHTGCECGHFYGNGYIKFVIRLIKLFYCKKMTQPSDIDVHTFKLSKKHLSVKLLSKTVGYGWLGWLYNVALKRV